VKSREREQLRRLKNTIMGAGHRLSLLGESAELPAAQARTLSELGGELARTAQRLERLLSGLDADG
jgi:hypothetical protein